MGSGETAPSLVGVHRSLLSRLAAPRAVWLDTPYGFQENADLLDEKTVEFFQVSLNTRLEVARYRNWEQPEVETQLAYAAVRSANYLVCGPGSPSYAQKHWSRSEFPQIFIDKLKQPGDILVFASAGLCSIGALCLPAYEIYKAGDDPHWLPGLDLLPRLGFGAVVLPHYNNTVGGNHDTRFCYLGERRLRMLEEQLAPDLWIWGVDEHTAVILDLDAGSFEVQGKGGFTLRRGGVSRFLPSGTRGQLDELRAPGTAHVPPVSPVHVEESPVAASTQGIILEQARPLEARFDQELAAGRGLAATQALLDFEQLLKEWSGDTDVHHWEQARGRFRYLLSRLGQGAVRGLGDPSAPLAPFVELLLELRKQARAERQFARADEIRQRLTAAGVEVQDTPDGARWSLRETASLA